eukprot:TRINITY_DN37416_c0_g1_i3.p1 TRINITY_DN37416_c0_g1~~TRINITY_DN37416_c0_g1_i3.p1  ORF type:complete len:134 (+),score=4.18 TRINITY_DN37416_c0_g1_i3:413-814(+)
MIKVTHISILVQSNNGRQKAIICTTAQINNNAEFCSQDLRQKKISSKVRNLNNMENQPVQQLPTCENFSIKFKKTNIIQNFLVLTLLMMSMLKNQQLVLDSTLDEKFTTQQYAFNTSIKLQLKMQKVLNNNST